MANEQNLKPIKPGESRNPYGRPKKLVNVIKGVPKDIQVQVYGVLAYALTLPDIKTAKEYLQKQSGEMGKYGFVLQVAIKQLTRDDAWSWSALMDIMDRLWGRPKQATEITASGEGLTIVVKSQEEKDKLERMGGLQI